jgi:hypothetical protein
MSQDKEPRMSETPKRTSFSKEIELALFDCRHQIRQAVRLYERDVESALRDLRIELSQTKNAA